MADHYARCLEHLEEIEDLREALAHAYATTGAHDRPYIADLHQRIGYAMKQADVHATLAVRQELQEIATNLLHTGVRL